MPGQNGWEVVFRERGAPGLYVKFPKGFQEPLNYALVDVKWVRRLDLTCDSHGTPPRESTDSDQIYH